ncbi:YciI family protein [Mesorhizobium sp. NBSH29]|uniref:YciI family protein n=1 Tax=Mesorhizobium sp. NBSH29 TaxID=2654249 RepID=UPI001896931F|nr:YciI family protein [Mesorhizobium sp. NBSH29]QPC86919.1 YciI family protein [Mesorhizobium sp. NBSH29]
MKYVCLVYGVEATLDALPNSAKDSLVAGCVTFDSKLDQQGQLVIAQALDSSSSATSVRVRGGNVDILDGPFAETKEQLLGFFMIEAADRQHALDIAAQSPMAAMGTIEVRPVRTLKHFQRSVP